MVTALRPGPVPEEPFKSLFYRTVLLLFAVMSAGLISENLDGSLKGVPVTNGCQ